MFEKQYAMCSATTNSVRSLTESLAEVVLTPVKTVFFIITSNDVVFLENRADGVYVIAEQLDVESNAEGTRFDTTKEALQYLITLLP